MKLWIGHYYGAAHEWFIAWGRTKDEAAATVDCEVGEPDLRSMKELKQSGFIDLKAVKGDPLENEDDPDPYYFLAQIGDNEIDRYRQDQGFHYDNEVYIEDDISRWIKKCIEEPFAVATDSPDEISNQLGIHQQELINIYKGAARRP